LTVTINSVDTGLAGRKPPHGSKPVGQRFFGSMHDCSGSQGISRFAAGANIKALCADPVFPVPTTLTVKTLWPFPFGKVIHAGVFGVKAFFKFDFAHGKIFND